VKKTNRLVCAEEGWGQSGIGSEIDAANLEALSLPGTEDVVKAAKKVCYVN